MDAGSPTTTVKAHDSQGADEIFVADIDASRSARPPDLEMLSTIAAECSTPLTFAGGIASLSVAEEALRAGADKVCLTTTALDEPDLINALAKRFGSQAIVVGVDVVNQGAPRIYDHRTASALDRGPADWVDEVLDRGAGEIRLMSVDREGTKGGLDIELLEIIRASCRVPLILEGGAGKLSDLADAIRVGVDGVALGTILVFGDNNLLKIKRYLVEHGCPMRLF